MQESSGDRDRGSNVLYNKNVNERKNIECSGETRCTLDLIGSCLPNL